jgi:signal transduction histidine kinase
LADIFGIPLEQVLATPISAYIKPEKRPNFESLLAQAAKGPVRQQVACQGPNSELSIMFSLSPMDTGENDGVCLVATDITEEKRLQEALAKYAAQLTRTNDQLAQFAFIASHDLQEPLRRIVSFGDLLREQCPGLDPNAQDSLDRMQKAARRMSELIRALLQYSRASSGTEPARPVELSSILSEVLVELNDRISASHAHLDVHSLPKVLAAPMQMRQVLQNLILNALKFQPPGAQPEVVISSKPADNGWWEIKVRDNGIGFDQSATERLFRPFQRLHGNEYPGTGMGLAICARLVNHYGGAIGATSAPGRGSTFYFTVPGENCKKEDLRINHDVRR